MFFLWLIIVDRERNQPSWSCCTVTYNYVHQNIQDRTKIRIRETDIGNPEIYEIGSGTKILFAFLSWRFFDRRRERDTHTQFLLQTRSTFRRLQLLPSARRESQLSRLGFKFQLTVFFSNSQILGASGHDVNHVPGHISYLGFLLWHLIVTSTLRAREHLHSMCAPN